jgi:YD repeat-containing protein
MKTKSVIKTALTFTILAFCLVLCTMCKKKETVTPYAERIKSDSLYINDTLFMYGEYTYDGNLLTEKKGIIPGSGDNSSKEVFQYTTTEIISSYTRYSQKDGEWVKMEFDEVTAFANDNPSEIVYHNYYLPGEDFQWKATFTYDGALLQKMDYYDYSSGAWTQWATTFFEYDDLGRISREVDTSSGESYITTYTYNSGQMTERLLQNIFEGTTRNDTRTNYEYSNGRLSKTINYDWSSETWIKMSELQYEYNEYGNLVLIRGTDLGITLYKNTFTYAEGSGNYRQCMKAFNQTYFLPGMPLPYPVKSVNNPLGTNLMKKKKTGTFLP